MHPLRTLVLCAALAPLLTCAQTTLRGTLTDDQGGPLPGATVVVGDDQRFGTSADPQGRYVVPGLRTGPQRVRIAHLGFAPVDTVIALGEGEQRLDLMLRPQARLLRSAEVVAVRAGERAPVAQSTLTREELARINTGVDLPILLDAQPSVVTTTDAGTGIGYTGLRVRGTDPTRINVTVNGVPINDAESQAVFWVNMPDLASSTQDVQLQRGVGTSTNGPGAFGASINLRTTTVNEDPFGEVSAFGGSFNTRRFTARAGTGTSAGGLSLDARLSHIASDGYIDRASADLKSYFVQGAWAGRTRSLRFITFGGREVTDQAWAGVPREVIDTNRTYNPYTYANEVDDYRQTHYQLLLDQQLGARTTINLTGFRTDGRGFFESYEDEADLGFFGIGAPVIGGDTVRTGDLVQRRWLDNTLLGVNASLTHGFRAHQLIVGGSYSDYRGDHFGEVIWARFAGATAPGDRYYANDARKRDANAFVKLTYSVGDRVQLYGDVQVRQVDHAFLGFDDELDNVTQNAAFTFFNPKAGVDWRVHEGGRMYASAAVANREPNRDDFTETTPGSRPTSERLVDVEAGYERRSGRLAVGLNGYYMDYTDQLVLTGELNDVGAALRTNVPRSYRAGLELTWALRPVRRLLWKGNATWSRNRILDLVEYVDDWDTGGQQAVRYADTPIAFSPEWIAGSELAFTLWDKTDRGRADIAWVTKFVGEQFLDNSGSAARRLDAFVVNDLRLNASLHRLLRIPTIDLTLTVRNILNEQYENNGWSYSFIEGGTRRELVGLYPQAPIHVLGGVTVRW